MSLRTQFTEDMKAALKNKETLKLGVIRMIIARLKEIDIEARGAGKEAADEEAILQALVKMAKQRRDAAETYDKGGRADLAAKERDEIAIIDEYLPKPLTEEELSAAISRIKTETEAASPADTGKVIAALKAAYPGRIDFGKATPAIRAALAS